MVDPQGDLLHYHRGPDQSLSLGDNTDPDLTIPKAEKTPRIPNKGPTVNTEVPHIEDEIGLGHSQG